MFFLYMNVNEPRLNETNNMAYVPSLDIDQPERPPSLIRVWDAHLKGS